MIKHKWTKIGIGLCQCQLCGLVKRWNPTVGKWVYVIVPANSRFDKIHEFKWQFQNPGCVHPENAAKPDNLFNV
ncbi:MAG: hypothetical protein WBJ22_01725 [Minisyncoccales bacterium]